MELSKGTKIAIWTLLIHALGYVILETRGAISHLKTDPWEPHAKYHGITGLFYQHALLAAVALLTWFPLRQGRRWGWWGIAMIALAMHGGHIVGDAVTDGGLRKAQVAQGSGRFFYFVTISELVLYGVALALSFRHVWPAAKDLEHRKRIDADGSYVQPSGTTS